jgi:hypothetical protein
MALYGQPNSWQCGPFALKHALLVQGVRAHEDSIARIAGSTVELGTDEHQLARAAAHYGAHLIITRRRTASATQRTLVRWLREQPVLLCLDQWDHWVTAVGADHERVVVLDSHFDTVLRVEPWEVVLRRMVYRRRWGWGVGSWSWYDLHAVRARAPQGLRLHLNPAGADRLIAAGCLTTWDDHVAQLRPLLSPGAPSKLADSLTMARMGLPTDLSDALDRFVAVADAFALPGRSLRPERVREVLFAVETANADVLPLHSPARRASSPA